MSYHLAIGDIIETSYGSGPYRVTDIMRGCTCPHYQDLLRAFSQKGDYSRSPHMEITCEDSEPAVGKRAPMLFCLSGYAETQGGSLRNVTTDDELRIVKKRAS
jgi:hypothetical protein